MQGEEGSCMGQKRLSGSLVHQEMQRDKQYEIGLGLVRTVSALTGTKVPWPGWERRHTAKVSPAAHGTRNSYGTPHLPASHDGEERAGKESREGDKWVIARKGNHVTRLREAQDPDNLPDTWQIFWPSVAADKQTNRSGRGHEPAGTVHEAIKKKGEKQLTLGKETEG
jgi:hypothetical protein